LRTTLLLTAAAALKSRPVIAACCGGIAPSPSRDRNERARRPDGGWTPPPEEGKPDRRAGAGQRAGRYPVRLKTTLAR
jgi:hypothetical protein